MVGVDIRVVDLKDETKDVPIGEEGELGKAPSVAIGYWNKPEATAETFLGDSWMKTETSSSLTKKAMFIFAVVPRN